VHELGSNFEYNNKMTLMTMMTSFIEIEDALSWRGVWVHATVCFITRRSSYINPLRRAPQGDCRALELGLYSNLSSLFSHLSFLSLPSLPSSLLLVAVCGIDVIVQANSEVLPRAILLCPGLPVKGHATHSDTSDSRSVLCTAFETQDNSLLVVKCCYGNWSTK
jgi:hypothetical protein